MANFSPKYDAWLHWNVYEPCNLNCSYCFTNLSDRGNLLEPKVEQKEFSYAAKIKRVLGPLLRYRRQKNYRPTANVIDIRRVVKTLSATKMTFKVVITGSGEPFLIKNIVEVCEKLSKNHYLGLHTNLTSTKIRKFVETVPVDRVVAIVASCHLAELERTKNLEKYIQNYQLCDAKGYPIIAKAVGYPTLIPKVEYYRKLFAGRGIELRFGSFIGYYNQKKYPEAYTEDERRLLDLRLPEQSEASFLQKGNWCNAGFNVAKVDPDGRVYACTPVQKTLGNIYERITFNKIPGICPADFCGCPVNQYDNQLFARALDVVRKRGLSTSRS